MTQTTFLGGKVIKQSLTVIHGRPASDAPALKRLFLPQGELAQIYDGEEGIRYLACMELRPGFVRGNHYHEVKAEVIYIIRGEILLVVEDIVTRERAAIGLQSGDLAVIPVRIAHGFRTIQAGDGVEWSPTRFDPKDIQPYALIDPLNPQT